MLQCCVITFWYPGLIIVKLLGNQGSDTGVIPKNPMGFSVKSVEKKTKTCVKLNSISVCHASNN